MLVLTFREGEPCYIGDDIKVYVRIDEFSGQIKLAIEAPNSIRILRSELDDDCETH